MASENEQENEKRETVADIADEIRRAVESMGDEIPYTVSAGTMRRVADRIEAAWKRECQQWQDAACSMVSDAVMSGRVAVAHEPQGNAAAMREALAVLIDGMCFHCDMSEDCKCAPCEKMQKAKAALSAPARNCDRFDDLRSAQRHYIEHGCPKGLGMLVDGEIRKFPWKSQFEKWLFAPAAERKGEGV